MIFRPNETWVDWNLVIKMILHMSRPRNETEDLLLSITKKYETLIEQTHTRAEESFEFKPITQREAFSFRTLFLSRSGY